MQNRARFETVFFDLDGTLTDPKEGITGSIQYALMKLGETVPSQDELTWCIGPPLLDSFAQLAGAQRAQEGVDWYRERFSTLGKFENKVYAGIPEVLEVLSARYPLYVASSKPRVFVDQILQHFDLSQFFCQTFGSGLDGSLADKSKLLSHALRATGVTPEYSLMIGDRSHDAVAAARHKMAFIGALYGFGSRDEYESAGYGAWAEEPGQIPGLIARA